MTSNCHRSKIRDMVDRSDTEMTVCCPDGEEKFNSENNLESHMSALTLESEPPAPDAAPEPITIPTQRRPLFFCTLAQELISMGKNVAVTTMNPPEVSPSIRVQTYIYQWDLVARERGLWVKYIEEVDPESDYVEIIVG